LKFCRNKSKIDEFLSEIKIMMYVVVVVVDFILLFMIDFIL
jgi:cytoskeletal protein RodZ